MSSLHRGDVVALPPPRGAIGHEQKGRRYGVVLQSSDLARLSTVIVAPTSASAQATQSARRSLFADARRACSSSNSGPSIATDLRGLSDISRCTNWQAWRRRSRSSSDCTKPVPATGGCRPAGAFQRNPPSSSYDRSRAAWSWIAAATISSSAPVSATNASRPARTVSGEPTNERLSIADARSFSAGVQ